VEHSIRKEKIIACVLIAISLIYLLGCINTSVGRIGNPGAGLIPRLIGVCLLISTGLNAFRIFKRRGDTPEHRPETPVESRSAVIGIAIVILLYPLLLYSLKAILATCVSSFAMLRLMRYKNVMKCLAISLAVSGCVYVIFGLILGVTFPSGPVEELMWRLH
jgi:putative tricarboxylic transport membrane protein